MKLLDYLAMYPDKAPRLASEMGVSSSVLYQWKTGIRAVPVRKCLRLEQKTGGCVTRKDTRPEDWIEIWPELADEPAQGVIGVSATQPIQDAT
jgi:DNA-binding transcriptional regulator YdaS (Cro superfamily)